MPEIIPCRCLLHESGQEDLSRLIADYIAMLPEEQCVPENVYHQRLALCKDCDCLRSGTCALCGCYVETRAAKRRMNCPAVPSKWQAYP